LRESRTRRAKITADFLRTQQEQTGSLDAACVELARALFNLNEFLYVD
jgi:hypothetical protein